MALSAKPAYHAPTSLPQCLELLAQYQGEARCLAGGTDLLIERHVRGELPARAIIDLKRIPELGQIRHDQQGLWIGATVPMARVARHPVVWQQLPMLAEAISVVGSYALRVRATLGGNIANASPAADTVPPLIAAGAWIRVAGPSGTREILLEDVFTGPKQTVLAPNEVITAIHIPQTALGGCSRYLRIGRRIAMDLAIVGVAVNLTLDRDRQPDVRIALASVAPTPVRAHGAEELLRQHGLTPHGIEAAVAQAVAEVSPISDARASRAYRLHLVRVLLRRGLESIRTAAQEGGWA